MIGFAAGSALATSLASRVGTTAMVLAGLGAAAAAAAVFMALVLGNQVNVPALVLVMLLFTWGAGLAGPALMAEAFSVEPQLAGSAAGLYGFSQMSFGTVSSSLASSGTDPAASCATVLLAMAVLSCACISFALREQRPAT